MEDTSERRLMSQAEFAREMNVSPPRVTQWKQEGILSDAAFNGPGRTGDIIYNVAVTEVMTNRDVSQSLGNGLETGPVDPDDMPTEAPRVAGISTIDQQLKEAKLEQMERTNRRAATDEAVNRGLLVASDDARAEMAELAEAMVKTFEGALPDFATVVAAAYDLPQRDVLHLMREEMRKVRERAQKATRQAQSEKPRYVVAMTGQAA